MSDDPFGPNPPGGDDLPPEGEPLDPDAGKVWNVYGLRNSQPHVDPKNLASSLDVEAPWWGHLAAGFTKQTGGSSEPEAWMHYVLAVFVLVQPFFMEPGEPTTDEEEQDGGTETFDLDPEGEGGVSEETFEGPQ